MPYIVELCAISLNRLEEKLSLSSKNAKTTSKLQLARQTESRFPSERTNPTFNFCSSVFMWSVARRQNHRDEKKRFVYFEYFLSNIFEGEYLTFRFSFSVKLWPASQSN